MTTTDFKDDCTLDLNGHRLPGMAHVVEVEYSEQIRFLGFVMQVAIEDLPADEKVINLATLILPDGRQAPVRVTGFGMQAGYLQMSGGGTVPPRASTDAAT